MLNPNEKTEDWVDEDATPEPKTSPKPERKVMEKTTKPVSKPKKKASAKKAPAQKKAKAKAAKPAKKSLAGASVRKTLNRSKATKAKGKSKGKKKADNGKVTLNFKVVPSEAKAIRVKADKGYKGNMTQMIRAQILGLSKSKTALDAVRKTTRV